MVTVFIALIFAAALGLLLALYANNPAIARARVARRDRRGAMDAARLRGLTIELLAALGLDVVQEELRGDERRLIAARASDPLGGARYMVFLEPHPPGDVVDQTLIIELAEAVKAERATLGMVVTPFAIDSGGLGGLEVPIEMIDGARLRQLVRAYLPDRLDELDHYRGFGTFIPRAPRPTPSTA